MLRTYILSVVPDFLSMLVVGLEPTRGCPQQILSLPRLPFRHTSSHFSPAAAIICSKHPAIRSMICNQAISYHNTGLLARFIRRKSRRICNSSAFGFTATSFPLHPQLPIYLKTVQRSEIILRRLRPSNQLHAAVLFQ